MNALSEKSQDVKDMDVFEAIKTRRSIRAFTKQDVSKEDMKKLLDAARWAPSAGNIQPWEFIVVRDPEIKKELSIAALHEALIEEAPVVVVVCANLTLSARGYGVRGSSLYCLQDTAAAIQNMLLAACALGLATCWIGAFHEEEAKKVLGIPDGVRPVAIIPVGYPAETPEARWKRPLDEVVHYETFRTKEST